MSARPGFEYDAQPAYSAPGSKQQSSRQLRASVMLPWQAAFLAAIAESDCTRALPLIWNAQKLLESRLTQIAREPVFHPEVPDIRDCLTYLGILLGCIGSESGEILWQ